MLEAKNISVKYGDKTIVDRVGFNVDDGAWLMIVGPNGAGKSTIVNAVSQTAPYSGQFLLDGRDVKKHKPHELARRLGVLSQSHYVSYSFTVREVIALGRYAYTPGIFRQRCDDDERSVNEAVKLTGLTELLSQSVLTLSGGELQRTFLAQLLAQNPPLLILDEPTNHLDLIYQKQIFAILKEWIKTPGRSIISVVHDLSLAKAYGTRALLLDRGRVIADGAVDEVLARDNLTLAYGMDVYAWMNEMLSQWK